MKRIIGITLVSFLVTAEPAFADCEDKAKGNVDWSGCQKMHLILRGMAMEGAKLLQGDLSATDFLEADLRKPDLTGATLARSRFQDGKLAGTRFDKVYAYRANFRGADMTGASLVKAEFDRAQMAEAKLQKADLTKASLGRADLSKADLRDAVLVKAYLARTNFGGAALAGADFTNAYFLLTRIEGTDLSAVRGLEQQQIDDSCGNDTTKLPAGLKPPQSWPCPPLTEEDAEQAEQQRGRR